MFMNDVTIKSNVDDISVSINETMFPINVLDSVIPNRSLVATSPEDLCVKKLSDDENNFINKLVDMRFESTN